MTKVRRRGGVWKVRCTTCGQQYLKRIRLPEHSGFAPTSALRGLHVSSDSPPRVARVARAGVLAIFLSMIQAHTNRGASVEEAARRSGGQLLQAVPLKPRTALPLFPETKLNTWGTAYVTFHLGSYKYCKCTQFEKHSSSSSKNEE